MCCSLSRWLSLGNRCVIIRRMCSCIFTSPPRHLKQLLQFQLCACVRVLCVTRGFTLVSFAPDFQCCYFCESSCLFYLRFNVDFYISKIMHLCARNLPRKPNNCLKNQSRTKGEGWSTANLFSLLAVPRRVFCLGSLVILDVTCCYLWLFSLYINIKISTNSC